MATDVFPVPPPCVDQRPRPRTLLPSTIVPRSASTPCPAWYPPAVILEARGTEAGPFIFTCHAFHTCRNDKIPTTHEVSMLPQRRVGAGWSTGVMVEWVTRTRRGSSCIHHSYYFRQLPTFSLSSTVHALIIPLQV